MKHLFFLLSLCIYASTTYGQTPPSAPNSDFAKAVEQVLDAGFQSDSTGLVKALEQLVVFTKNDNLAHLAWYYIAFGKWQAVLRQTQIQPGDSAAIQLLTDAIKSLEKSTALKTDFVEAYALGLNGYFALYYLQPQQRMALMEKAEKWLQKAKSLDPENPLLVLTEAQNVYYTPEQFGGSKERGIDLYWQAIELFKQQYHNSETTFPKWGLEMAFAWLGNAYFNLDDPDLFKAKEAFLHSLELRPDFVWVKDNMLPAVDEQLEKATAITENHHATKMEKMFASKRITQSATIILNERPDVVFPLFGAYEERKWAPGWNPKPIYPHEEIIEEGASFKVEDHGHEGEKFIWIVTKYQPEDYLVEYLVFTQNRFWTITVHCQPKEDGQTKATITYRFTGLNDLGNQLNQQMLKNIYEENLNDWERMINDYLKK